MAQRNFAGTALAIAGMMFLLSAIIPVFRGQPGKGSYAAVGVALFVVGGAIAKKGPRTNGG